MIGIAEMFAELDGYARYESTLAVVAALKSERARDVKATRTKQREAGQLEWRHGLAMYGLGCRCETCRKANTDYMREYQRNRYATDPAYRARRKGYDNARRKRRRAEVPR